MTEDSSLLRAYVETDDESAFAKLVQRYVGFVYHVALRQLSNPSLAEDAAQVVFTRLAQKAPSLTRHPSLAGWLHTTTRFVAQEAQRSESRRFHREQEAHLMQDLLNTPPPHVDWEHLRPVIDEALGELNEADRSALLLRYFSGLPLAEVGERLNVSANTARVRVDRALMKLQPRLARRGVTSTAAALAAALGQHTAFSAPAGLAASITGTALAQLGATSASLAAFPLIHFMTTTKFTTIIAGSVAALSLGTAFHQATLKAQAESGLADQVNEYRQLAGRLEDLEQRQRAFVPLPPGPQIIQSASQPPIPAGAPPIAATTLEGAIDHLLVTNPELASLFMRQETIRFGPKYRPLYHALNFTPEQIARFESVLTEHAQAKNDIQVAGITKGFKRDDPAIEEMLAQAGHERDARLRELLDESAYSRYQEFERTSPGRTLAHRLASEFFYTPHPLTAQQGEAIARIAIDNSAQVTGTGMADWDNMISQARSVLSPQQLESLREMKEQAELGMKIHKITGPVAQQFPPAR